MAFRKGEKRPPNAGRRAGTPNKVSKTAQENIIAVFDQIGGQAQMARWAKKNQTAFYGLYARLIPVQHTGEDGGPIRTTVRFVYEEGKTA